MNPRGVPVLAGGWLLAGLVALGCAGGEAGSAREAESADPGAPAVEVGPVRVDLTEYMIDMPVVLPAGETVLRVTNRGIEDHNLRITRVGADEPLWRMANNLSPGETRLVTLDLAVGKYVILCDFAGHDTRGMFLQLDVRSADR